MNSEKFDIPVFIIGGSRTGSELFRGILEKYSQISFVNEMHLLAPKWLRKDFNRVVEEKLGGINENTNFDEIVNLIDLKEFDGYYWMSFLEKVNIKIFKQSFLKSDRSLKAILECAMTEQLYRTNKKIRGAKFPVHYSFVKELLGWFPNAKLIHTVRDPRAIYYSQSRKYLKPDDRKIVKLINILKQFLHIIIQVNWTAILHLCYESKSNYFLLRYENLVKNPERVLKEATAFLDISYHEGMGKPKVFSNSSFPSERGKAKELNVKSVNKWKKGFSSFELFAVTFLTIPSQIVFGYKLTGKM